MSPIISDDNEIGEIHGKQRGDHTGGPYEGKVLGEVPLNTRIIFTTNPIMRGVNDGEYA